MPNSSKYPSRAAGAAASAGGEIRARLDERDHLAGRIEEAQLVERLVAELRERELDAERLERRRVHARGPGCTQVSAGESNS